MIKPFTILNQLEEIGGTMVTFKLVYNTRTENQIQSKTIKTAIKVPTGYDIDEYIFNYAKEHGWIL